MTGDASPSCNLIDICSVGGGGVTPSSPPCTAPDTLRGSGPSGANGHFNIAIAPPLQKGECIYAFDTCTSLVSPVRCATVPAPAPALSGRALALAVGVLSLMALLGLARLRRDSRP